ncbi:Cell division cycle protein cdt2 [Golovinomyces cichoracearum]|uniref:Cell division cycle protein cdt2 n=1 Tax=Golovinomyces cichoracearum TaxID=62708 RepID=A0A420IWX3_9PEZI|nr:Cell division cycle protein cdt2 [Golovinomyces cichoracearum]
MSSDSLSRTCRQRKDPSVTPRKFRRFFTPRNIEYFEARSPETFLETIELSSKGGDIRSCSIRRLEDLNTSPLENLLPDKKRRLNTPSSCPAYAAGKKDLNLAKGCTRDPQNEFHILSPCERAFRTSNNRIERSNISKRILPLRRRGLAGQIFERSFGNSFGIEGQSHIYPVNRYEDHTGNFYSTQDDVHVSISLEGQERTIPFCAVACNTNSLVAVGDEDGQVRFLEAGQQENTLFKDIYLSFRVHQNAIIDMSLSEDDFRLVTASGDQSSRVVDIKTQTTISILGVHTASLKQARFQPGSSNNNVIATSSRDGSIHLWDLRCKGYDKPQIEIQNPTLTGESESLHYGAITNSIYDAHKLMRYPITHSNVLDTPIRGEIAGRFGDVSVTAIQFLSSERNHLLISASEADSTVKLWDIRNLHFGRRRNQVPLSSTEKPQSHNKWRHFGISSMNVSSDGTRLFTLCKDNTVYAYSTTHLILGQTPDLNIPNNMCRRLNNPTRQGLGPIYGFRHSQFHATTFYVKSAIRKPVQGRCELLAVGSSDGCAVLFPTDERYFPNEPPKDGTEIFDSWNNRTDDRSISISTHGTALIQGHNREVGSLSWTCDGSLVTVGDDFLVRIWREGREASNLRSRGEQSGRNWGCGWSQVNGDYDKDDT